MSGKSLLYMHDNYCINFMALPDDVKLVLQKRATGLTIKEIASRANTTERFVGEMIKDPSAPMRVQMVLGHAVVDMAEALDPALGVDDPSYLNL